MVATKRLLCLWLLLWTPLLAAPPSTPYRLVDVPVPAALPLEAVSFLELPDGRLAIGTRHGDVFLVSGAGLTPPQPEFQLFASGLHEVFGLAEHGGDLYVTQQGEVTRLEDRDGDGRADRFETVSDAWGFGGEHEFAFGSGFDAEGYLWVALCLTNALTSENPFRGWCLRIHRDGTVVPTCSGIRSPGGLLTGFDGATFYTESQGQWNGTCSLKHLKPGAFMGHPASLRWYHLAPGLQPAPPAPRKGEDVRLHLEARRIQELVPPAVWFPYKKMGQSATAIVADRSGGKFGPFTGQLFVADYTLSTVMRVFLETVDGVYQGACFPFAEGFSTGLVGAALTTQGQLFVGGCSRGWPSRGTQPYALQRLDFTGTTPFELLRMGIQSDGFELTFTAPLDPATAADPAAYDLLSYSYHYRQGYGSPEVDRKPLRVLAAEVDPAGDRVRLRTEPLQVGSVHELHLPAIRARTGEELRHAVAYYTVNRIPAAAGE